MPTAQRPSRIWSWFEAGLTPAIELGERLRTPQKLVLVALLALAPVVWLIVSIESESSSVKQFSEREIEGVQYLRRLLTVLPYLNQARIAGGSGAAGPGGPPTRAAVSEVVNENSGLIETDFRSGNQQHPRLRRDRQGLDGPSGAAVGGRRQGSDELRRRLVSRRGADCHGGGQLQPDPRPRP
ncbi:MAG: hypothetical protein U0835_24585 [Isosphaeraceae bacterium]